ncbi:Pyridoxine-5'-phosphate oxidase [Trichinella pseudospiralis]|uniref:Pyridoxine-5'-phosphate oxidase n=1 Tax=Trichinella pseudospiralis TaxID=6337 RepID=A0A0V1EH69_TRIPS|nr:Pyridoxine-5'-phosphate oxidase [Trichinella pseudospiralis]
MNERKPYCNSKCTILESELNHQEPFGLFAEWFKHAQERMKDSSYEVNAMALSTVSSDGKPSSRMVLLKAFSKDGFQFYSDYESRKGRELANNASACLLFYWPDVNRCISVEGTVKKTSAADSDAYWKIRPVESALSAYVSHQSMVIPSRQFLENKIIEVKKKFVEQNRPVPRPSSWGGYVLVPNYFEFWQGQSSRLHDRLRFRKQKAGEMIDPSVTHRGEDDWIFERFAYEINFLYLMKLFIPEQSTLALCILHTAKFLQLSISTFTLLLLIHLFHCGVVENIFTEHVCSRDVRFYCCSLKLHPYCTIDCAIPEMEAMHKYGVSFELWLQESLQGQAERFLSITKVGDPDLLILYLLPFLSAINRSLFLRFVLATAICDMLNNIMKWMLNGERPYWWIHSSGAYEVVPPLQQFPLTCETGPGSPSGHAMITASVWYIIVWGYVTFIVGKSRKRAILTKCAWFIYLLLLIMVAVSRLYIATHFPHQVMLGSVIGFVIGVYFTRFPVEMLRMKHCLALAIVLVTTAFLVYVFMILLGVEPDWSVKMAMKWCQNREWVHLNTTPLNALFRDTGAIIGLGLAVHSRYFLQTLHNMHRDGSEIITALVTFILVQCCACIPRPSQHLGLYYLGTFVQNCCISFGSVALVPYVVKMIWNLNQMPDANAEPKKDLLHHSRRKLTACF